MRLSDISKRLFERDDEKALNDSLKLLDQASEARDEKGESFLSIRTHFFQRTLSSIWACANSHCPGRQGTILEDSDWGFGKVFLDRRSKCDECGFPVYEIGQCNVCGEEVLFAQEKTELRGPDRLEQRRLDLDEDEFQQELDPVDLEGVPAGEEGGGQTDPLERLITKRKAGSRVLLTKDGTIHWDDEERDDAIYINMISPKTDGHLHCPDCDSAEQNNKLFWPIRLGAPFFLQTAIPVLLKHVPPLEKSPKPVPAGGRRILGFTDSRQGTARLATKLQLESERDFVRSILYHALAEEGLKAAGNREEMKTLKGEITALKNVADDNPFLNNMLEEKKRKYEELKAPRPGRMSWEEARAGSSVDGKRFQ